MLKHTLSLVVLLTAAATSGAEDDSGVSVVRDVGHVPGRPRFESPAAAGDVRLSLSQIPLPRRVIPGQDRDSVAALNETGENVVATAVFGEAAVIDWPNAWDNPAPRGQLIIYEGMTVRVFEGGRYEVTAVVEAPRTAVSLDLQLTIFERVDDFEAVKCVLTLPPIVIEPDLRASRHEMTHSHVIRRTGYCHALRTLTPAHAHRLRVTRRGGATFGYIPDRPL